MADFPVNPTKSPDVVQNYPLEPFGYARPATPEEIDLGSIDDLSLDDLEADLDSSLTEEGASEEASGDAISEEVAPDTAGDSEFDDLEYNKVDKALKSVGVSLKDANG